MFYPGAHSLVRDWETAFQNKMQIGAVYQLSLPSVKDLKINKLFLVRTGAEFSAVPRGKGSSVASQTCTPRAVYGTGIPLFYFFFYFRC